MADKLDNARDKVIGEVQEAVGKVTGNEVLELKGKILSSKSDLKDKMNIDNKVNEIKEGIAGKINNFIDKNEENKKDK